MTLPLVILGMLTLAGAVGAVWLRNLVHCALSLAGALAGLAGIYLWLDAQFVGFAQILVYVGAVAILIVFAILLTGGGGRARVLSRGWIAGAGIAVAVFAFLSRVMLTSKLLSTGAGPAPDVTVREIGDRLMTQYVVPLEVIGLLLTAALIGAVIIAMPERRAD